MRSVLGGSGIVKGGFERSVSSATDRDVGGEMGFAGVKESFALVDWVHAELEVGCLHSGQIGSGSVAHGGLIGSGVGYSLGHGLRWFDLFSGGYPENEGWMTKDEDKGWVSEDEGWIRPVKRDSPFKAPIAPAEVTL
ncbi:hypothetical protein CFP56_030100 [Quercus suber]|uniref:Uncharacterized protein n=1 Tax=Quercus suber TaxID=58331 RepID=A0AAW0JP87_QUESU